MATYKNINITEYFLDNNPNSYFVFGDNLERRGTGGAAKLRLHPHAIGFITKKFPDNNDSSFYKPTEYFSIFFEELHKLSRIIKSKPDKKFFVSQLGSGLANRYYIWQTIIHHNLTKELDQYQNVVYCWKEDLVSSLEHLN